MVIPITTALPRAYFTKQRATFNRPRRSRLRSCDLEETVTEGIRKVDRSLKCRKYFALRTRGRDVGLLADTGRDRTRGAYVIANDRASVRAISDYEICIYGMWRVPVLVVKSRDSTRAARRAGTRCAGTRALASAPMRTMCVA